MTPTSDGYAFYGTYLYTRINGHVYRRVIGEGWCSIPTTEVPTVIFEELEPLQRDAFISELQQQRVWQD